MSVKSAVLSAALILGFGAIDSKAQESRAMVNEPTEQSELAVETLKLFQARGEDLSEPRHTVHYFYDGDFRGLGKALRAKGFEVRSTVDDDGVIAERMDVTDENWRVNTLTELSVLANEFGAEYDGWEAALRRQADQ